MVEALDPFLGIKADCKIIDEEKLDPRIVLNAFTISVQVFLPVQNDQLVQQVAVINELTTLVPAARFHTAGRKEIRFACQNGILTTAFQRFRRIFLRTAQDPKAASERLYRILALLNNSIDQSACIRTERRGFLLEVWNVPVAIILVLSRHITWNNDPVFLEYNCVCGCG